MKIGGFGEERLGGRGVGPRGVRGVRARLGK